MEGAGPIRRAFTLACHLNAGQRIMIVTDACPYGIGGFIVIGGSPRYYFYDAISAFDQDILGVRAGTPDGQQRWECLAALVALRLWKHIWEDERVQLHVRADNVTTLTMLRNLRVKGKGLNTLAQEAALDVATASYEPDVLEHTPGVHNSTTDVLSRPFDPTQTYMFLGILRDAIQVFPHSRDHGWYRWLAPP